MVTGYQAPSEIYLDMFESWADVKKAFGISYKEPDHVYLAYHGIDTRERTGECLVFFRNKGKYYIQESFTSVKHSLKGEWDPLELDRRDFIISIREILSIGPNPFDEDYYNWYSFQIGRVVLRRVTADVQIA